MAVLKGITIIGGGLAGLTLGIGLRRKGIPVTVLEAGRYPRHRVCGEFISGRGQDALTRLGLREAFAQAGSIPARTGAFFLGKTGSPVRPLPVPALCLSRFTMDALLAKLCREAGGELRENERWRGDDFGEGVVRASGRRLEPAGNPRHWFGVKVHARNVPLAADLEMHGARDGYIGFCRLQDGEVNVCGLFRRTAGRRDASLPWRELLRGQPGTPLHQRMAGAVLDEASFCSVAGLSLKPQRAAARQDCSIGDALTMIPPVTGNGMSMAFEAAEMAIAPLAAYSSGAFTWMQARQAVARACDTAFAQRLAWARWLQWMMFTRILRTTLGSLALNSDWLWRTMFARTR
jgi:2-polyprenyl-6-methoxyphenol hydroxylase-like FAD-dependent oxidoreductase